LSTSSLPRLAQKRLHLCHWRLRGCRGLRRPLGNGLLGRLQSIGGIRRDFRRLGIWWKASERGEAHRRRNGKCITDRRCIRHMAVLGTGVVEKSVEAAVFGYDNVARRAPCSDALPVRQSEAECDMEIQPVHANDTVSERVLATVRVSQRREALRCGAGQGQDWDTLSLGFTLCSIVPVDLHVNRSSIVR